MKNSIRFFLGVMISFLWAASSGATLVYTQGFEGFTPATEFASGDFDPPLNPLYVTEGSENFVQVVNVNTTTVNDDPFAPVKAKSGLQSLKIDGETAGGGGPFMQYEPASGMTIATTIFHVYGDTGDAVGGGRLFEAWIDDTSVGAEPQVWSIRVDESGDLFIDTGGWVDTGVDVTLGQWNKFTIAADVSVGGSEVVNLWLNDVQVGGNIYQGTGDSLDQWQFQANGGSGLGSGVFYDDITIDDTFIPEPSTLLLCVTGGVLVALRRRMHRA